MFMEYGSGHGRPIRRRWDEKCYMMALPITAVDGRNRHPWSQADASHWVHHIAYPGILDAMYARP